MKLLDLEFKPIPALTRPSALYYRASHGGYAYYWFPRSGKCKVIAEIGCYSAKLLKLSPAITMVMLLKYP